MISPITDQIVPSSPQSPQDGVHSPSAASQHPTTAHYAKKAERSSGGDTVTISDRAQQLATANTQKEPTTYASHSYGAAILPEGFNPPPEHSDTQTVVDETITSGRRVVVERYAVYAANDKEQKVPISYSHKASIFGADGKLEFNFAFEKDIIITQDEDGNITGIKDYTQGDETSGDDIIIGHGSALSGGDGDDTIISLNRGLVESNSVGTISGGNGDDTIIALVYCGSVNIDAGDGNDVVEVHGGILNSSVITGEGDDTVRTTGMLNSTIDTGNGDDSVQIAGGMIMGTIRTGDGDDTVDSDLEGSTGYGSFTNTTVDTGDGNDTIRSRSISAGSTIDMGDGNDSLTVAGILYQSTVKSGAGNDYIQVDGEMGYSSINTGKGDDTVHVWNVYHDSTIDTGDGNDTLTGESLYDVRINTGNGKDRLTFSGFIRNSSIYTGDGIDRFMLLGNLLNSTLDMGKGNDLVTVRGKAYGNRIYGGAGQDRILLSGPNSDNKMDSDMADRLIMPRLV